MKRISILVCVKCRGKNVGYKKINAFICDTFRKKSLNTEKVESFWESLQQLPE